MAMSTEAIEAAPREIREAKAKHDQLRHAIRQMERHVTKDKKGDFQLAAQSGGGIDISSDLFDELKKSLEFGNQHRNQRIVAPEEFSDSTPDFYAEHSSPENHQHTHWWGVQIYANDPFVHEMVAGAQKSTAAIAAILVAFGVTAVLAAAIGAAVFLIAGLIWAICAWGGHKGMVLTWTWSGYFTVWHQ